LRDARGHCHLAQFHQQSLRPVPASAEGTPIIFRTLLGVFSMAHAWRSSHLRVHALSCLLVTAFAAVPAGSALAYQAIDASQESQMITLTGHDLTIEQIVAVARHGAHVQLGAEAKQRQQDNYGLLLEAAAEGVSVYWFNRGAGDQREIVMFSGDATSAENRPKLEKSLLERFRFGSQFGFGPEIDQEEIVRAMMVVRANAMTFNAPSPQLSQMLLDLLNHRVTPVVQSRGTLGEGDLAQLACVGAAMVGAGDAYYRGTRMTAAQALKEAGLAPLQPFAADDNALISSDAYATGQAALVVNDAREALEWADLIYAMDLNGMNSSITPLSKVVQDDRPQRWLNWNAGRVLDMIKGSYLFNDDPKRIIQDPESLRASSIRQASAWEAWAALRDAAVFQANSSDHNPAVRVGIGPNDSWELATPQMMKFFVKGGPLSRGKHGFIVSNANWDPYPLANHLENFIIAMANMDIAVMLRIDRFSNPFFTVVKSQEFLPGNFPSEGGFTAVDLQQEIQSLTNPVAPFGASIVATVEDLQAQTRIKAQRARQTVNTTMDLLAHDLLTGALWLDIRHMQDANRQFGAGPTAAWQAVRGVVPLKMGEPTNPPAQGRAAAAVAFMWRTPAVTFYSQNRPPEAVRH
jgi:histidine ammonia-lyase